MKVRWRYGKNKTVEVYVHDEEVKKETYETIIVYTDSWSIWEDDVKLFMEAEPQKIHRCNITSTITLYDQE